MAELREFLGFKKINRYQYALEFQWRLFSLFVIGS